MRIHKTLAAATLLLGLCASANAAWVFSNDAAGDGSLVGALPSFTIVGSNNGVDDGLADTASYVQTFDVAQRVTLSWRYDTADSGGGAFDPAGYVLGGQQTQLSVNGDAGEGSGGTATVTVGAHQSFGWYVSSIDSEFGRAQLSVAVVSLSPVPEPASGALLAAGALTLAGLARRRRR